MSDGTKSAFELAMERLKKKDAEQGIVQKTLTPEQKAAIAEIRQTYAALLAQEEILHASRTRAAVLVEEREKLDEEYRRDVQRLHDERERKIETIRNS